MAQDGMFIKVLSNELNQSLKGARIDSIDGLNKTDFCFKVRTKKENLNLYMSVSYNNPTIFLTPNKFEKPSVPTSFTMYLRKHLQGGIIEKVFELNSDRVIEIDVITKDEIEGSLRKRIVLELIGRFSNLLLLDDNMVILDAVKQLSVLELDSSRSIMRGLPYIPLKNDKLKDDDIDLINNLESYDLDTITNKISGISKLLGLYLESKYKEYNNDFYDLLTETSKLYEPTLYKNDFYFFNIFNKDDVERFNNLSDLLYKYYLNNALDKILKDNNQDVFRAIESNKKRLIKKLDRLNEDLRNSENADIYRLKGELLQSIAHTNILKKKTLSVLNYYNNEMIDIDIDESKSIQNNSQIYYKKYKKAKTAVTYIEHEIELAKSDLEYFELLSFQIKNAGLNDINEIRDELISNNYLKNNKYKASNKKKKKPQINQVIIGDTLIYVGKNNIQNNYLTHTLAKKDDLWFHIKGGHGAHVIVTGINKYDEDVIRAAAKLAAINSEFMDSSSVAVDYTLIKYLKKVPGTKGSFVTYKTNKTIYIDPKRED